MSTSNCAQVIRDTLSFDLNRRIVILIYKVQPLDERKRKTMSHTYTENTSRSSVHAEYLKYIMAKTFHYLFLMLSISLIGLAVYEFTQSFSTGELLASGLIKTINIAVVSLAIFELGVGVGKEYDSEVDEQGSIYSSVRRSITRFVAVVCIALVLEGLIMVIKYSQLELAGNLSYPVAIIVAASLLLLSLGGFLKLTADTQHI